MSYLVEHVRYTLECDVCGRVEKRDLDAAGSQERGTQGWSAVEVEEPDHRHFFCCPECSELVAAVLLRREREAARVKQETEASCAHEWELCGMLQRCKKCKKFR